jgi:hypothetical protein
MIGSADLVGAQALDRLEHARGGRGDADRVGLTELPDRGELVEMRLHPGDPGLEDWQDDHATPARFSCSAH